MHFARAGDCIVVWKLDRRGRSIQGLISLAANLSPRKVDFRSLTDGFDTSTASGRLLFHILASVAEMERELIKERTIADLAAARKKGGIGSGRNSALTPDKLDTACTLLAAGDKPAKVTKLLQVGLSSFYRHFPASERASSLVLAYLTERVREPQQHRSHHLRIEGRRSAPQTCFCISHDPRGSFQNATT